MTALSRTVSTLGRKGRIMAWFLAIAILFVSLTGLLLTRKMSRQLARTAEDAWRAQERGEQLNSLLQAEIEERRRIADDLRTARDELELRVRERTAQLSDSNRSLAMEIGERKQVEYALASEKERLAVTLRSIGEGVISTGMDGRIVLMNMVAEELTGWRQNEACGRPLPEVFRLVRKKKRRTLRRSGGRPAARRKNFRPGRCTVLIGRDGARHDIADSGAPIRDRDSVIIGVVLVFRDVTVKKHLEEDALKNEKLRSVGVLAGGIAHDFNNILAGILGNISLARVKVEEGQDEGAARLLEEAETASLRARGLTRQLLTFA